MCMTVTRTLHGLVSWPWTGKKSTRIDLDTLCAVFDSGNRNVPHYISFSEKCLVRWGQSYWKHKFSHLKGLVFRKSCLTCLWWRLAALRGQLCQWLLYTGITVFSLSDKLLRFTVKDDKKFLISSCQYHGCWFSDDVRSQASSRPGFDLVDLTNIIDIL